ncbi:FecR domain-containing protein [Carboxylicivirga sediminis]|uniref:FecR domain-containing protein n=1 Tax=Carboxylicivirga sediminis TaxID=2006564 RepID=A0A941F465_9BACT|nr:FecR domain-containing protein [Carboxylicivirga sediminis]MBR8535654.1 FecR domain-containing protein [Carboxylicivirga sediminis]
MMNKENENIRWSLLAKDVSGELSTEEHEQLQKELANNQDIEKQVKKLWGDAHYAQALKNVNTNKAWSNVKSQINSNKKSIVFKRYMAIAATLAIIIVSSLFVGIISKQQTTVISTAHTIEKVVLPDGTIVDLNHGSTITFPKKFKGNTRKVQLNGEAFFDVARNESVPFIIETEQVNIRVLGTSFNVKAYGGATNTEVIVTSGKVKVDSKLSSENVILEAGDAVNYSINSNTLEKHKVFTNNYKAWKTKELEFNNTSLSEVIKTIEDSYHISIIVGDSIVTENKVLNATFSKYSLEHVLESVCTSFNLQYSKQGDAYFIENKH